MVGGETMIVAGVGFSSGVLAEDILALVRDVERAAGVAAQVLAAPDFKADAEALGQAAERLELPLVFCDRAALEQAQARCETHSEIAESAVGLASVAEACALAAAGVDSRLLVPRMSRGKTTCALAGAEI
jgi:cobalt-precorrin 5A hydrolase